MSSGKYILVQVLSDCRYAIIRTMCGFWPPSLWTPPVSTRIRTPQRTVHREREQVVTSQVEQTLWDECFTHFGFCGFISVSFDSRGHVILSVWTMYYVKKKVKFSLCLTCVAVWLSHFTGIWLVHRFCGNHYPSCFFSWTLSYYIKTCLHESSDNVSISDLFAFIFLRFWWSFLYNKSVK